MSPENRADAELESLENTVESISGIAKKVASITSMPEISDPELEKLDRLADAIYNAAQLLAAGTRELRQIFEKDQVGNSVIKDSDRPS